MEPKLPISRRPWLLIRMTNKTLVLKTNWMAKTKMRIIMVLMMCKRTKLMMCKRTKILMCKRTKMMMCKKTKLMISKRTKMMMWSPCDGACVKFPAFDRVDGSLPRVGVRG